jgi:predicted nucleotidyltransferase
MKIVDIEKLKPLIIERLKLLNPDKIILFGSYAYGTPNEESDIDLFLVKDVDKLKVREERLRGQKLLWELVQKEQVGFDLFIDSQKAVQDRIKNYKDQFYQEILSKGKVLYVK